MSDQPEFQKEYQSDIPSPREFMKRRRPERFSDSQRILSPAWSPSQLSYHLDTITNRSDENEFEEFARQLLKQVVAPNFSAQTGPMGGGDGKVDSDTYPVADKLAFNWLTTDEMLGGAIERWALAASTKKDWNTKIKGDIKKIVDTERGYIRAFFVSSRHIPARKKHEVQDKLEKTYGIKVTIFDREWIIDTVLSKRLEKLFAQHLKYTNPTTTTQEILGPNDTAKLQRIKQNNSRIDELNNLSLPGLEIVHLALENAILARGLEKEQDYVETAFARALRLAKTQAGDFAIRNCHYHWAWTMAWWYEDWESFLEHYQSFKSLILDDNRYFDLERLHNLWSILFSQTKAGRITLSDSELNKETSDIRQKLKSMTLRDDLPNASLSARTSLAIMNVVIDPSLASSTIKELHSCIKESTGHIEYSVSKIAEIVTALENILGDYDEFQTFFDDLVKISTERTQKSDAARMLLKRCFGLTERERNYQALVTTGQAIELLKDGEDPELLSYAFGTLSAIYETIGLPWASRAACLTAFSVSLPSAWNSNDISQIQAHCLNRLKWLELKLGWIAHATECHLLEMLFTQTIESDYYKKPAYLKDRTLFDGGIAIHLLRANPKTLNFLRFCPDNLDHLDLFFAASAGRHALGHPHKIPEEMDLSTDWFAAILSQPMAKQINAPISLGLGPEDCIQSSISGCKISIKCDPCPQLYMLAKAFAGFIEAFMATCMQNRVIPRSPILEVLIQTDKNTNGDISYQFTLEGPSPLLTLTIATSPDDVIDTVKRNGQKVHEAALTAIAQVFVIDNIDNQFSNISEKDFGFSRAADAAGSLVCESRLYCNKKAENLRIFQKSKVKEYPLISNATITANSKQNTTKKPEFNNINTPVSEDMSFNNVSHDNITIPPLIRLHLWDTAKWLGTGFFGSECGSMVPVLIFIFKHADKANLLWDTLSDDIDKCGHRNTIRLSIIQGISATNPYSYRVTISPGEGWLQPKSDQVTLMIGKSHTMTPNNNTNLARFMDHYHKHGKCEFIAGTINKGQLAPINRKCITVDGVEFRQVHEIGPNDLDAPFIFENDDVIIPEGVNNAPITKLLKEKQENQ